MIPVLEALKAALAGVAVGGVHLLQNNDAAPKLPYLLVEPVNMDPFLRLHYMLMMGPRCCGCG